MQCLTRLLNHLQSPGFRASFEQDDRGASDSSCVYPNGCPDRIILIPAASISRQFNLKRSLDQIYSESRGSVPCGYERRRQEGNRAWSLWRSNLDCLCGGSTYNSSLRWPTPCVEGWLFFFPWS